MIGIESLCSLFSDRRRLCGCCWQAWPEGSKPKVTVLVWNQINGYVDWLRHDFLQDARWGPRVGRQAGR